MKIDFSKYRILEAGEEVKEGDIYISTSGEINDASPFVGLTLQQGNATDIYRLKEKL